MTRETPLEAAGEPSRGHLAAQIREQADACGRLGSPLYAALLHRVAEDVTAGGPCAEALAGYEGAAGPDAIALRLLGGVHALVLTGRAPALAAYYPSAGGSFAPADREEPAGPAAAWPAFRSAVAANLPWVRDWLTRPPQTNEVGRANLLITGLLRVLPAGPLPVRLFELGSSAGLNLLADRFRCTAGAFAHGPADSPVQLRGAWQDAPPGWLPAAAAAHPALDFTERHGCDLTPIDPASSDGALALRAYVWPDQSARTARLDGALELAAKHPVDVRAVGAAEFLRGVTVQPGALTVVWHSIMRQYVPKDEWHAVEGELARLAGAGSTEAPFAYIAFEPRRSGSEHRFVLTVRAGDGPEEVLAEAVPHGLPARPFVPGPEER